MEIKDCYSPRLMIDPLRLFESVNRSCHDWRKTVCSSTVCHKPAFYKFISHGNCFSHNTRSILYLHLQHLLLKLSFRFHMIKKSVDTERWKIPWWTRACPLHLVQSYTKCLWARKKATPHSKSPNPCISNCKVYNYCPAKFPAVLYWTLRKINLMLRVNMSIYHAPVKTTVLFLIENVWLSPCPEEMSLFIQAFCLCPKYDL